jgi:hypothetical protein
LQAGAQRQVTDLVEGQTWQNQRRLAHCGRETHLPNQSSRPQWTLTLSDCMRSRSVVAGLYRSIKTLLVWRRLVLYVLDKAFRRADVASVLKPSYELVDVDIGEENKNLDIAAQYEVPLNRGVPAVAVLDSSGKLIYSQKSGEWERARALGPLDLLEFLNKWKPQSR